MAVGRGVLPAQALTDQAKNQRGNMNYVESLVVAQFMNTMRKNRILFIAHYMKQHRICMNN
jgi:hypothetical protein